MLFLRPLPPSEGTMKKISWKEIFTSMIAIFRLLFTLKMALLVPFLFNGGLEQSFIFGNFTATVIQGSIGSQNIGFVMATFGTVDAVFSLILGKLSDKIGRVGIVCTGLLAQIAVCAFLVANQAYNELDYFPIYMCAAVWGFADAVSNTMSSALLGALFPNEIEAAFSNLKLWQSVGFAFLTALSIGEMSPNSNMNFKIKVIIVLAWSILSLITFLLSSWIYRSQGVSSSNKPTTSSS